MTADELDPAGCVTLNLLDASLGRPIQTWHFEDRSRVSIGRGDDNDICLADARVSRMHAELLHREGAWRLVSHGRNGTLIDGEAVSEAPLADRTVFQLGPSGPSFQLVTIFDSSANTATIDDTNPITLEFLMIDEQSREAEVQQIVEGEAFRQLQEQARSLQQENNDRERNPES